MKSSLPPSENVIADRKLASEIRLAEVITKPALPADTNSDQKTRVQLVPILSVCYSIPSLVAGCVMRSVHDGIVLLSY